MLNQRILIEGNVVRLSHAVFREVVVSGDTVIDATCGHGWDSLILAKLLQGFGKLVAYDIQKSALISASTLFEKSLTKEERAVVELKNASHEIFSETKVKLIHYNLGYLPKGNKDITTLERTTLRSLESALKSLLPRGVVTIVCYPGHEEGKRETSAVEAWAACLNPQYWQVSSHYVMNRLRAPRLLVLRSLDC